MISPTVCSSLSCQKSIDRSTRRNAVSNCCVRLHKPVSLLSQIAFNYRQIADISGWLKVLHLAGLHFLKTFCLFLRAKNFVSVRGSCHGGGAERFEKVQSQGLGASSIITHEFQSSKVSQICIGCGYSSA